MSAEVVPFGDIPAGSNAGSVMGRLQVLSIARRPFRDCGVQRREIQATEKAFALAISRAMGMVVVTAHGRLGASEAVLLQTVLGDLIEGQGNLKVVLDAHDVSGLSPSSLDVLVAATDAASQIGGELTFADPSDACLPALEAIGLGDAITLARHCGQRAPEPALAGQDGAARRAAMAEHPAGSGRHQEFPWSLVTRLQEPTITTPP